MKESIKKYQFKEGMKLEFEILDLGQILQLKEDMMKVPHRAQFYHVLWIEKGHGTHYVDFKPVPIEDNSIIFIPFNSVNVYDFDGSYEGKVILFTESFFCKNNDDHQFLHSSILFSDLYDTTKMRFQSKGSDLKISINSMEAEYKKSLDSAQYQLLHNMLHIFLLQAEREIKQQGFNELKPSVQLDQLLAFKSLLEKQYREEKSVKYYASELHLSEKQLNKATTSILDKTPKQIIDERVLLESKRLLAHSSQSVKEIAYDLGYDEPTNFIKYFKKHVLHTPSEFRDQF